MKKKAISALKQAYPHAPNRLLELLTEEAALFSAKGHDYASGGNRFGNFERVAEIMKLYPGFPVTTAQGINILWMLKQLDSLMWMMCQGIDGKVESKAMRAKDVSVYADIFQMIEEESCLPK